MKFRLGIYKSFDGDTWVEYHAATCAVEGAYSEDEKRVDREKIWYHNLPCAVLDDDGNPIIKYERVPSKPSDAWLGHGFNHREEGDYRLRDVTIRNWYIEFETLEQLEEFAKEHDAEITFGDDPPTMDIYE